MPAAAAPASTLPRRRGPRAALAARWQRWWSARLPRTDTLELTQRNLYILPTAAGWMLALTLLVLLVASINFQLNLGYLLTFLLAGCAAASVHVCHGTLRGLTLHLVAPEAQFAGSAAPLQVQLHSSRRSPRRAIALALHGSGHWALADVPAGGSATLQVAFAAPRRGLHDVPVLTAQTLFPLGAFRVWTLWRPAAQLLVYPQPEVPAPPLPPGEPQAGSGASASHQGAGEFDGVRAWRAGDGLRQVVWKKAARALATGSGELVSRDTQHSQRRQLWLDAAATGLAAPEARLSRLASWVLQADRMGVDYGLRVPGRQIAPATGPAHRRACLEALALC
ncbi:Uncharacterized conserved protein, DUF58 family, contains vWF domain [Oryzisolibacter propanilivorax]|uniref:Uncharacterized conserved protein, DUF58 family, contains vWF domain n=1 Tax=Oryzisolibacter propanilivorax TaxID=1527607 RepID=A0A1G9VZI6_9BURK|nr:DUF58 domain-containing protein [Oryzisolibacter propanilivorax]SDM77718.1 Uncharacterized conserved protein, DUF58 family, contains vWF domain [Oryzisolibacter propanilivorax]